MSKIKKDKELHEIKNKKRLRAVKDKKRGGVRLRRVSHRKAKTILALSMVGILGLGIFGFGALGNGRLNQVDEGFVTVKFEVPTDGSTPDVHTGIENIGYMNSRFLSQTEYYSEMHSMVSTIVPQTVDTYKQYSNGVLIQSDIAKSSLINEAQQFCWVGDDVLWRMGSGSVSSWNGIDTPWKTGTPAAHMKISDYTREYGLPGTAFSVYVLREETVTSFDPVLVNGDGTYTQTFYLDPASDKAPAHYGNQMVFKGGLSAPPAFDFITVTYTFDSTWQVLSCDVEEKYTATKKGIPLPASCSVKTRTEYSYGSEKSNHTAYDGYFKQYVDEPVIIAPSEKELTAVECLGAAFSGMLAEPTSLKLNLDLNGVPLEGILYLDVNNMDVRADFGNGLIRFWYIDNRAYLAYGGLKVQLEIDELMDILANLFPDNAAQPTEEGEAAIGLDVDAILGDLAQGEFKINEKSASLVSQLTLFGLTIPVDFSFDVGEDITVTLNRVETEIAMTDFTVGARLSFCDTLLPALAEADKAAYVEILPYMSGILDLLKEDALHADLSYRNGDVSVSGALDLMWKDGISASGAIDVTYKNINKTLKFAYCEEAVYLELDGIRIKAGINDIAALVKQFAGNEFGMDFDFSALIRELLSEEFGKLFELTEQNDNLNLTVKATQLLKLLGVGFAPEGFETVVLGVSQHGQITVSASGAQITVTAGDTFSVETEGYVDLLPYLDSLVKLFSGEAVSVELDYQNGDWAAEGAFTVNLKEFAVSGKIAITYRQVQKEIGITYFGGNVYLDLDGIRLQAGTDETVDFVRQFLNDADLPVSDFDAEALIEKILSLNFGDLLQVAEAEGTLSVVLQTARLLEVFGIEFDCLGEVKLFVTEDALSLNVIGASVSIVQGTAFDPETLIGEGYISVIPYAQQLVNLFTGEAVCVEFAYKTELAEISGDVEINLDFSALTAKGVITVAYEGQQKDIIFAYARDRFWLDLDGIRLQADKDRALSLIGRFIDLGAASAQFNFDFNTVIGLFESNRLGDFVGIVNQNGTSAIVLKGTQLLKTLGLDFNLGDVTISTAESGLKISALGADVTISSASKIEVQETDYVGYADILPYVETVAELVRGTAVRTTISYVYEDIAIAGDVTINLKDFALSGDVKLTYAGKVKNIRVSFWKNTLYLDLAGVRVKAGLDQLSAYISQIQAGNQSETIDFSFDIPKILQGLFEESLSEWLAVSEDVQNGVLDLTVDGNKILTLFGLQKGFEKILEMIAPLEIDLDLSAIQFGIVKNGGVTLGVAGLGLGIEAEKNPVKLTEQELTGYVDVMKYVEPMTELFRGEAIGIDVAFKQGAVALDGTVSVLLKDSLVVKAELMLTYGATEETDGVAGNSGAKLPISIYYRDDEIYVDVYGLQARLNATQALSAMKKILPFDVVIDKDFIVKCVKGLFVKDPIDLLKISEKDGVLGIALNGNTLLDILDLGIKFNLGEICAQVSGSGVAINALGATLDVHKSEAFAVSSGKWQEMKGYADLTPYLSVLPDLLERGMLSLCGSLKLSAGGTEIALDVKQAAICWKPSFTVYFDALVSVNGVQQRILVSADKRSLKFVYGEVGADIVYDDLATIDEAFVALYKKLDGVLSSVLNQGQALPEIEGFADLFEVLKGLLNGQKALADASFGGFDLVSVLQQIKIRPSALPGGICRITLGGISVELYGGENLFNLQFGYESNQLALKGSFGADIFAGPMPQLPENVQYLTASDFAKMLYYLTAAVETLAQPDLQIEFSAVTSGVSDGAEVSSVSGTVTYHTGGNVLFTIDKDQKSIVVTPELYLNVSLAIENAAQNTYFDLLVFDYDGNGVLDFFVTLSNYCSIADAVSGDPNYRPLKLYASADELMTVLSAGLAALDLKSEILNDYIISKWLEVKTAEQLAAVVSSMKLSLSLGDVFGSGSASGSESVLKPAFLTAIQAGDEEFTIWLNSEAIFGKEGLSPVTLTIGKSEGLLSGIVLANLYNSEATEVTGVTVGIKTESLSAEALSGPTDLNGYFDIYGIGALLKTVANTVTHQEAVNDREVISGEEVRHKYVLNSNYYINGSAKASIAGIDATIDVIAISVNVDENGDVGLNIRLKYSGVGMVVVAISGDSTLDLTVKNGMVYMKRVQTSIQSGTSNNKLTEANYITMYRAMPMDVFFADVLNQLGFMLNLADWIMQLFPKEMNPVSFSGDYGAIFESFLKSFSFTESDAKEGSVSYRKQTWDVVLNGGALTSGVMTDIRLTLSTNEQGCIKTLGVDTGVSVSGSFQMSIQADLALRNPQGVMDEGVSDVTCDIADELEEAIGKAVDDAQEKGWKDENGNYIYVSGTLTRVSFVLGGETLKTQSVMLGSNGELLANLQYPDLSTYQRNGYTLEWQKPEGTIRPNQEIFAVYTPNQYHVTFVSDGDRNLGQFGFELENGKYVLHTVYVYDDGFYLADREGNMILGENGKGIPFSLPEADDCGYRLVSFLDGDGNEYRTLSDCKNILSELELTAKWEKIEYDIVYRVNGTEYTQTAFYGDAFRTDIPLEREGYAFDCWVDENGIRYDKLFDGVSVTGARRFTAVYRPLTYAVTLVSQFEIEGFDYDAMRNEYRKTVDYTYGSGLDLPSEVKVSGHFLDGFAFSEGGEVFTQMPAVTENTTLYAVWSELGYDIVFEGYGKTITRNYEYGAVLSNLPEVPYREGYTGAWSVSENYVVTGADTIYAEYLPIKYTVNVYSDFALAGYTSCGEGYVKSQPYVYTYGTAAIELSGAGMKVAKYDFAGYFTQANGNGVQVSAIDETIVGLIGNLGECTLNLYAHQVDNTVTVTLASDYRFEGSVYGVNEFVKTVSFNDDYALAELPRLEKYQQLGWWYFGENGWTMVDDVKSLSGATVWAMWIQNVSVEITNVYTTNFMGGSRYNLEATLTGGRISGKHGTQIAQEANLNLVPDVKADLTVYNENGEKPDTLKEVAVSYSDADGKAKIEILNQNCLNYADGWGNPRATFAGTKVTLTFSLQGHSPIATTGSSVTSVDPFTVIFQQGDGSTVTETLRACPYLEDGVKMYADEIAPQIIPAEEKKDGFSYAWPHMLLGPKNANQTIEIEYTRNLYNVRFECGQRVDGWLRGDDGMYYYETQMLYGAPINVYEGETLWDSFTVSHLSENNVFVIPAYENGREWTQVDIDENGAELLSYMTPDKVTYISAFDFIYEGKTHQSGYTKTFEADYTLFEADKVTSAEGYRFLGWYAKTNQVWAKVQELSYSQMQGVEYTVEALWEKIEFAVTATRSGGPWPYTNTTTADLTHELIGAFANDSSITKNYRYEFYIKAPISSNSKTYVIESDTIKQETYSFKQNSTLYQYGKVGVTICYRNADGSEIYVGYVENQANF